MASPVDELVGQRLLLAFRGKEQIPGDFLEALRLYRPAGVTLFRSFNIEHPAQVRRLTGRLQEAARRLGLPPLLIAVDQEGGQLMAVGDGTTQLPGNMALGATRDAVLARRAGEVLGAELRAMGINIDYAPCCDVNINPANPVIGVRSFGEDPRLAADLAAAMVEGIQSRRVAATAKHFPGHGDTAGDSHHGLPVLSHSLQRFDEVDLPPFAAAIRAGVRLIMTGHLAIPALDGRDAPPATLSPAVLRGLLREKLGFQGVIVTDAMDMHAIAQGDALGASAIRAAQAGADLLLLTAEPADQRTVHRSLMDAVRENPQLADDSGQSLERVTALRGWLTDNRFAPGLEVVGCAEHRDVAHEIGRRSVTLVRNDAGLLPLRLRPEQRVAVIIPRPADLTPADTSSYVTPALAASLLECHPRVRELVVPSAPSDADITALVEQLPGYDLIVLGTLNAFSQPAQRALAEQVLQTGIPTIVVAMRLPYDLAVFPQAKTYACTYSILEPSMRALAGALFGKEPFGGRLPVSIPGLYQAGFACAAGG